jgi:outer membrane protein assembly factor BamA
MKKWLLSILSCTLFANAFAQISIADNSIVYSTSEANSFSDTTALFIVTEIIVEGNRKTQEKVILRELSFQEGGQYSLRVLIQKFKQSKEQLLNTTLFQNVVVSLKNLQGYDASIKVSVKERWYIFPIPFISVVDNSFQHWVKNENMDLNRIKYGVKIKHKNFTGRNDKLTMNLTNGYTKEVAFRYEDVPVDRNLKWLASFSTAFGRNRDINYATFDNKRIAYKNPNSFVHSYFKSAAAITYRPAIKTRHTFSIGFNYEKITDTILKISPDFSTQKDKIVYPEIFYKLQYFDVDFIPYPTKGFAADIKFSKKGFGGQVDVWQTIARTSLSVPLSDKYYFNWQLAGVLKLPFDQPYNLQNFVGTEGLYLQGYEDYVIDGVAGGFTKLSFARQIINTAIHLPLKKVKQLNYIPIKIYGKIFSNAGYIYNKNPHISNTLSNRSLNSGGIGLDIILFYNFIFKVEWSFNHLRQNGIYLHDRRYL